MYSPASSTLPLGCLSVNSTTTALFVFPPQACCSSRAHSHSSPHQPSQTQSSSCLLGKVLTLSSQPLISICMVWFFLQIFFFLEFLLFYGSLVLPPQSELCHLTPARASCLIDVCPICSALPVHPPAGVTVKMYRSNEPPSA